MGSYILDFACCSPRVVVELDGGQHDLAVAYDTRRTSWLESQGWTVLRCWNNEIDCNEEAVQEIILQKLSRLSSSPRKGERKSPPTRALLRSDLATIATNSRVDYNNRLSVRTVYLNNESPDFQAQQASTIRIKAMGFLSGKRILVTGVASKLSIAYGIAQAMHREGAELAFTYQNDKLKGRVEEFAAQLGSDIVLQCDVAEDASIDTMFAELAKVWPKFDGFVHSIGFAPGDQLDGDYVNAVTREGFKIAHDISSYSFVAMAKACRSMLNPGSALLTLSYLGAERAIPNYNVMGLAKASLEANVRYMANAMGPEGVRVNAISAGPIRTLAASGIKDFRKMLAHCEAVTPIRRTVTIEDVGNSAAFLCSDLSAGISGEVVHVDGGFSIAAMNELELK